MQAFNIFFYIRQCSFFNSMFSKMSFFVRFETARIKNVFLTKFLFLPTFCGRGLKRMNLKERKIVKKTFGQRCEGLTRWVATGDGGYIQKCMNILRFVVFCILKNIQTRNPLLFCGHVHRKFFFTFLNIYSHNEVCNKWASMKQWPNDTVLLYSCTVLLYYVLYYCTMYCIIVLVYCIIVLVYCIIVLMYCIIVLMYCIIVLVYFIIVLVYCIIVLVYCIIVLMYFIIVLVYCIIVLVYCIIVLVYCIIVLV